MKKKIILALSTIIIIIGVILFATRTDKQRFISYLIRDDIWKVLEEKNMEKYAEKQNKTPYSNKGEINVTTNKIEEFTLGMIQDINLNFEGKTNNEENKIEQNITIDDENQSLIKFKQDGQKYGIQTEILGEKFVAIENNNLKDLAEKFGFESENIPNKIGIENYIFTEEQIKALKNSAIKILNENISKNQFSKEKNEGQTVISLTITEQQIIEILKEILQQIRNDEEIEKIISELESLEVNPNNKFIIREYIKFNSIKKYEIIFVEEEKEISKTTIQNTDNEITLTTDQGDNLLIEGNISKKKEQKDVIYDISIKVYIEGQKNEFILKAQYKNLQELDNVEEIFEIKFAYEDQNQYGNLENTSNEMGIDINYSNKKTFESNLEMEGFNEENTIILNTATNKEIQTIIKAIYKNLKIFE